MTSRKREIYAKYLESICTKDVDGFGLMYEQIKQEMVHSVICWLNLYLGGQQGTSRPIQPGPPHSNRYHRGGLSGRRPNYHSQRGSYSGQNGTRQEETSPITISHKQNGHNSVSEEIKGKRGDDSGCSSGKQHNDDNEWTSPKSLSSETSSNIKFTTPTRSSSVNQGPSDPNLICTQFVAGQVWPEWCQWAAFTTFGGRDNYDASDNHQKKELQRPSPCDLMQVPVYFDQVNNRLCVYYQGMVEYPQTPQPPQYQCPPYPPEPQHLGLPRPHEPQYQGIPRPHEPQYQGIPRPHEPQYQGLPQPIHMQPPPAISVINQEIQQQPMIQVNNGNNTMNNMHQHLFPPNGNNINNNGVSQSLTALPIAVSFESLHGAPVQVPHYPVNSAMIPENQFLKPPQPHIYNPGMNRPQPFSMQPHTTTPGEPNDTSHNNGFVLANNWPWNCQDPGLARWSSVPNFISYIPPS